MGGGAKPFYPALMDLPSLTPEARLFIEAEARKRLGSGSQAIAAGQVQLHHALSANDPAAMQQAIAGVRQGVLEVESGAAALQAVSAGQPPRQIALTWFKGQMSAPAADVMSMSDGPWGLSWYHLTTMAFLVAFMLGAILIHYARLRRIGGLVQRLTPGAVAPPAPAGGPTPASAPTSARPDLVAPIGPSKNPAPAPATAGVSPAQSPTVMAASAPNKAPIRSWSGTLRVAAIFRETPNVKTFRLLNPDGGTIPFTFLPGQFLTFSAELDGKPVRRSYTIASSPTQCDYVEITVKREDQGAESRYLHDHVAIGDRLEVSGPSGVFTFTGTEADSIVLISGGVGITPMMCVIRYLTDRAFPGDIFFLYGARSPQDLIFREELEHLQRRHRNLHIAATIEHADGTSWTGAVGNISKEFIAHAVPEIAWRRVHVCGPPAMMKAVKAHLLELGVAGEKIKTEAFGPARGAAPAPVAAVPVPQVVPVAALGSAPVSPALAAAPAAPAVAVAAIPSAQVEVQFSKSGKTGTLAPDQSVLEAAEAIGVAIDFSCRVGTCGTCVVPLLQGSVTMEVQDGLSSEDKARGMILACQAKSAGPLVVDA
jgi:ferredoxin-NADP reductase